MLFACDRGDKPGPQPELVNAGALKSAAPAASTATPASAAPSAPPAAPPPAITPSAGTLRLAIITDGELLKTDQNRTGTLAKVLEKAGQTVNATPATADESAYAKALAEKPAAPPALVASWGSFETVVLIRIEPPRTLGGQKITGGRSHLAIVHPPAQEPVFSAVYTDRPARVGGASTEAASLGSWLQAHLKLREKGKTP